MWEVKRLSLALNLALLGPNYPPVEKLLTVIFYVEIDVLHMFGLLLITSL